MKATIYFNGQPIQTVEFEKYDFSIEGTVILYTGYGDSRKNVAIIPQSHLIIII